MAFELKQIRRHPVKSMGGEDLTSVALDSRGIVGDRLFAVRDAEGHFASGKNTRRFRRHDEVFDYRARTVGDHVEVARKAARWFVGDPQLDEDLSQRMGLPVTVAVEADVPHQDMGSISVVGTATLKWCADRWGVGADPRRLRVNLLIDTDEPFIEESWVGRDLTLGAVRLACVQPVPRCRMIDIDQDGVVARGNWLKPLAGEREMNIAVYADVLQPATLQLGDALTTS